MADTINCLRGCIQNYKKNNIRQSIDTHILMPWVKVSIGRLDGKEVISVSNFSSRAHQAVIKSFQYGASNGMQVEIEIVDEIGGQFRKYFDLTTTGGGGEEKDWMLRFQWGWSIKGCSGPAMMKQIGEDAACTVDPRFDSLTSCPHTVLVQHMKAKVEKGLFKFTIVGVDRTIQTFQSRAANSVGTDKGRIPLKQAVIQLMNKQGIDVDFLRIDESGQRQPFQWLVDGAITEDNGPLGVWNADNRNPIEVAIDWVFSAVSKKKKGTVVIWDTTKPGPTLVFLESTKVTYEQIFDSSRLNVGTYLINGGQCSPVISFTPQYEWNISQAFKDSGGFAGDATAGPMRRIEDGPGGATLFPAGSMPNLRKGAGIQVSQFAWRVPVDLYSVNANVIANDKKMVNQAANRNANPITAELRIQGQPAYSDPIKNMSFFCSLVYIDPFYIGGNNTLGECGWLITKPPCDPVLSNSNWRIQGVFHEIREGSYTTTLKLFLDAPGMDLPRNSNLGASADGVKKGGI